MVDNAENKGGKVRTRTMLTISVAYLIIAAVEFGLFLAYGFRSFPLGIVGLLGFVLTYEFFKMRKWAVFLAAVLFLPRLVFGTISLYVYARLLLTFDFLYNALLLLMFVIYAVLIFTTLGYSVTKREAFR